MPISPQQIVFKFSDTASEEDITFSLKKIGELKGIFNARAIFNSEEDTSPKKLFIAEVDPAVNAQELLKSVSQTLHVEYAELPPTKRLPPPYRL